MHYRLGLPRSLAAMRSSRPGAAGLVWTLVAGDRGGAAWMVTLPAGMACSRLKINRPSTSPQPEHMKVWCSKPDTAIVSSSTTFIKCISAPHAIQRIARTHDPLRPTECPSSPDCRRPALKISDRVPTPLGVVAHRLAQPPARGEHPEQDRSTRRPAHATLGE